MGKSTRLLREGDVIEITKKHLQIIYKNISPMYRFIGKYVVYKTTFDGGGCGHGPHDIYPNGHHVFCKKLRDNEIQIDFYQSGCFAGLLLPSEIKPIGKAVQHWKMFK